jgi:type IV secretion system protein VirB2
LEKFKANYFLHDNLNKLKDCEMTYRLKNEYRVIFAVLVMIMAASPAFAAGTATFGATTDTFVSGINTILKAIGVGVATIAVFIFGYQVGFTGKSAAQAAPILIGGFIIGAAATIASALVGNSGYGATTMNNILLSDEMLASNVLGGEALLNITPGTLLEITPTRSVI